MVKGKLLKPVIKQAKNAAEKAKIGGGVVALEHVEDMVNNPWVSAAEGALIGGAVAGPWGAAAGGVIGFILADGERVMPVDMIAIPAYQYSMVLQGKEPTFQIYIKEGEVVAPITPTDAMVSQAVVNTLSVPVKKKRAKGAGLPKKYAKMGFKKGWKEYKKTAAYKKRKSSKKRRK